MKNTFKNHIYIALDNSGSMGGIIGKAVQVFNNQIQFLKNTSLNFEQETRISFYTFNNSSECVISDVDVTRPMELENIGTMGMTALIDAITVMIKDAKEQPQKYGDHSFLMYVITDGGENASSTANKVNLPSLIKGLPDNFTIVALVPDTNGKISMERLGIPKGNIDKWEATDKGIEEVGKKMEATIENYFTARSKGVRSCSTVFTDLTQVTAKDAEQVLSKISSRNVKTVTNEMAKAVEIKDLVEDKGKVTYIKGRSYYKLVKTEHIQPQKEIIIREKNTKNYFSGQNARKMLNLPDQEVKFVPGDFGDWDVFVQSTSVNRKIIPNQEVLVLK